MKLIYRILKFIFCDQGIHVQRKIAAFDSSDEKLTVLICYHCRICHRITLVENHTFHDHKQRGCDEHTNN